MKKVIFILSLVIFWTIGLEVQAIAVGESLNFFIQSDYDLKGRDEIPAALVQFTPEFYFYIDQDFWYGLSYHRQNEIRNALTAISKEFKEIIYPTLTDTFGSEWRPGIDKDERITVLIHPMPEELGGYFNSSDEYPRLQVSTSNQREMVYLNSRHIEGENAKIFLTHEFMHLISFNQKEREYNVSEEIWLAEAISEYAPTLLGYDSLSIGNPFRERLEAFVENPNDSLTEWQNKESDYGVVNIFTQYLVDRYGVKILVDSLHSEKIGIEGLNYALEKNDFKEDFPQVFTDWAIATLVNNCDLSEKYCYKNKNLKNFRIASSLNFLPLNGKSSLIVTNTTKNWSGNWYKFVGGRGDLQVRFVGSPENIYKVPYLTQDFSGNWRVSFFQLDAKQRGEILIPDFGTGIISVTLVPSLQTKVSDFSDKEASLPFFLEASTILEEESGPKLLEKPVAEMTKDEILAKISELEELLSQLKARLSEIIGPQETRPEQETSCRRFDQDLFYGLTNDDQVKCLQEFLKDQGLEIYPEGLVTGNFLGFTQTAVIRFQEKYAEEILRPLGLEKGTGFFGPQSRQVANRLIPR